MPTVEKPARRGPGENRYNSLGVLSRIAVAKKTRIDTLSFTGSSGQHYTLRVYVWKTAFKAVPGVYVVVSRSVEPGAPPRYEPLFVGATNDLSKVFEQHPRHDCFQLHYANTIGVLKEADAGERARIVADLTAALRPHCNGTEEEWRV